MLGTTAAQQAAWNTLVCPNGLTKQVLDIDASITDVGVVNAGNYCVDTSSYDKAAMLSKASIVGAGAVLLLAPGWTKLLALPLVYLWAIEGTKGGF